MTIKSLKIFPTKNTPGPDVFTGIPTSQNLKEQRKRAQPKSSSPG